ncbi:UbiA-domain-containing protein [Polyplosphaeria fusca]|uniref:UbiA-domain-containing protein n=1 Tax=Polyplosphaeria fusca TaxID=682080 RepID=A0A9P4UXW4_9PLEO|nr:UbiA-domain-containing protein [Polyplosphaeria fusca]
MSSRQNGKPDLANGNGNGHQKEADAPPQLWNGEYVEAWVRLLPASWTPYIQLARLSPPVPLLLIFFPHLFGVAHAAFTQQAPLEDVLRASGLLFAGSFFFSNAIHGWNDLIDAPIDKLIPRTQNRPIVRGAISPRAAFIFTVSQAALGAVFLPLLSDDAPLCVVPSIIANFYYPFAKRHTYFPQVVLGVCLQWAVILGSCAMGVQSAWTDPSVLCLFFACLLWTVVYDTVYGYQDYYEDIKHGVKSTAVLFGSWGKVILWLMSNTVAGLLVASGYLADMGPIYFTIAVGGTFTSLNVMMAKVNLQSPESCSWWFAYGFWGPAISIYSGLLSQYLISQGILPVKL